MHLNPGPETAAGLRHGVRVEVAHHLLHLHHLPSSESGTPPPPIYPQASLPHGGRWSNRPYVALALFSLLATCVVF